MQRPHADASRAEGIIQADDTAYARLPSESTEFLRQSIAFLGHDISHSPKPLHV